MNYKTKTPVVSIFFNRPEKLKKSLNAIAKVEPERIYFISDGSRFPEETSLVKECRKAAEDSVCWPCEIIKIYSDTNLGCKYNVYNGISEVFKIEKTAIIIEDDIIPSIDFFRFMDLMIDRYSDDENICQISGYNGLAGLYYSKMPYMLSMFPSIWGWATWSSKWNRMDIEMNEWKQNRYKSIKNRKCISRKTLSVMARDWDLVAYQDFNTWDYQWKYARISNGWCGIVPSTNLIENIGFDEEATHTKCLPTHYLENLPSNIDFEKLEEICKSTEVGFDEKYEKKYQKMYYEREFFRETLMCSLRKIKRKLYANGAQT